MNERVIDNFEERLEKAKTAREKHREPYYDKAREVIGDEGVLALREYMTLYDERNYLWAASLWDPERGGFYYSLSAKETDGFLPDIESTAQMMRYLANAGIIECDEDGMYGVGTPPEMREKLISFAQSLYDPEDGYVYHPQWGQNITVNRRGRDLGWATGMLRKHFKVEPVYKPATDRLSASEGSEEKKNMPEHLTSIDRFREYLKQFENEDQRYCVKRNSYALGNYLNAQHSQIRAAGKEYVDALIEWFNYHQEPDNGAWTKGVTNDSVNGLMKIALTYSLLGRPIPNADKAIVTAIEYAKTEFVPTWVCAPYNTWHTIKTLLDNATHNGQKEICDELRGTIVANAPALIRNMKKKVEIFKKSDGGFSYYPETSISGSQSAPVARDNLPESDVNATCIASTGSLLNMCGTLGIKAIPIFCREDSEIFFDLIDRAAPVVKTVPIPERLANRPKTRQY